jgi:viroplasmin and RNaseH domain-containing protein
MEDQVIGFSNNNYGGYDTFEEAQEEYQSSFG